MTSFRASWMQRQRAQDLQCRAREVVEGARLAVRATGKWADVLSADARKASWPDPAENLSICQGPVDASRTPANAEKEVGTGPLPLLRHHGLDAGSDSPMRRAE